MENKDVPYIVYEGAMASSERHIKRLIIALIICIILLFTSNALWLLYESQFDTFYYEQDGNGVNTITTDGEVGDIINYGTESEN